MAEQGPPMERQVVPKQVITRTLPAKDNKPERNVWDVVFEYEADGKKGTSKAGTWSGECAKVCEENVGKPLLVTVVDTGREFQNAKVFDITKIKSADGKVELYTGGQTKKGGPRGSYAQRPDWSYEDKEERESRARSIEAQVASKSASYYFANLVQFGNHEDPETAKLLTVAGALEFHKKMAMEIAKLIRTQAAVRSTSAAKSGSGQAERPRPTGGVSGPPAGAGADGDISVESPPGGSSPPFAPGVDVPNSGPDLAADELTAARNAAIEVFRTPKAVEQAWAVRHEGELRRFQELTAEELAGLAANPPSGSQQTESETAGMAGGWS